MRRLCYEILDQLGVEYEVVRRELKTNCFEALIVDDRITKTVMEINKTFASLGVCRDSLVDWHGKDKLKICFEKLRTVECALLEVIGTWR